MPINADITFCLYCRNTRAVHAEAYEYHKQEEAIRAVDLLLGNGELRVRMRDPLTPSR